MDIKIFILIGLYPFYQNVLNEFNYHSIFLKSLFGLNSNNDNIRQIKKKISKYIEKSKFSSLKECLSALIENIHRKIIFIGN